MKDPMLVASVATRVRFQYGSDEFEYIEAQLHFWGQDEKPTLRLRTPDGGLVVFPEVSNAVRVKVVDL